MVNFGIAYGLSPHGLSDAPGHPDGGGARRSSSATSPATRASAATSRRRSSRRAKRGYVETLFGRRRLHGRPASRKNRSVAQAAERAAINMPIQGTAADLIKMAMLARGRGAARSRGCGPGCCSRCTTSCSSRRPDAEVEAVKALARRAACPRVAKLKVPLKVDVGAGTKLGGRALRPQKNYAGRVPDPRTSTPLAAIPRPPTNCDKTKPTRPAVVGAWTPIHTSRAALWRAQPAPPMPGARPPFRAALSPPARHAPSFSPALGRSLADASSRTGRHPSHSVHRRAAGSPPGLSPRLRRRSKNSTTSPRRAPAALAPSDPSAAQAAPPPSPPPRPRARLTTARSASPPPSTSTRVHQAAPQRGELLVAGPRAPRSGDRRSTARVRLQALVSSPSRLRAQLADEGLHQPVQQAHAGGRARGSPRSASAATPPRSDAAAA